MISFKDFVPSMTSSGGFFSMPTVEQIHDSLARAKEWIAVNNLDVVNIETVVLPNIHDPGEEGSTDAQIRTSGEMSAHWYQFIRVWYRSASEEIPAVRR